MAAGGDPSVLFYSFEGGGLGHLSRALTIGRSLRDRWPAMAQLLVGSGLPTGSLTVPPETEFVKLPAYRWSGQVWPSEPYRPRVLPMGFGPFLAMRRDMLLAIGRHFQPDLVLVDHMPAGLAGELAPTLRDLQRAAPSTRFVLGLRDIAGNGPIMRQIWSRYGADPLLEELYDRILVFGQRDVYDAVEQFGLSPRVAAKVRYVGYLRRETRTRSPRQVRRELGLRTDRLVLVTVGGGSDAYPDLRAVLQALGSGPAAPGFDCVVVAGPLMPAAEREHLRALLPPDRSIRLLDAVVDLVDYVAAADVVVARAGYNTVCEILSFGRPAVLVPRATVNMEQLLRAEALAQRGLARLIRPDELTPERLLGAIDDLLAHPDLPRSALDLNGLPATASQLEALLGRQPPGTAPVP
ncbi:MAG: hypothetical protein K0Q71_5997 [Thermomicrobiales bacterium]|nr:hypothetical protein [Thermomicrobiales bacterium]